MEQEDEVGHPCSVCPQANPSRQVSLRVLVEAEYARGDLRYLLWDVIARVRRSRRACLVVLTDSCSKVRLVGKSLDTEPLPYHQRHLSQVK